MSSPQIERKLAAIMFTDIVGYTALSAKDENKTLELLDTQKQIIIPIIEEFNGILHNQGGDSFLFTFSTVTDAIKCGIKIQKQIEAVEDLNLRIGIHEGEITLKDGDVLGDDVNIASRIEPFSAVGGIAISGKVQQNISSLPEFETTYVGTPKLKGVAQEVKVYCITSHGLPKTDVSKVSAKLEDKSNFNIYTLTGGILTAIGIAFWISVGVFDVSFGGKMEVPSVGILMMENLGNEDEEFWSSGMTADLITKVAGAGLIRVASLKDVRNIDANLSINEIAKKLRVKYILTHQFLIKDDGFDLWCKLENIGNGVALFSNKISEPMDMTTQMVGKLANDIITSLKVKTVQDVMKAPTANVEAYEYYLQASYKFEKMYHHLEKRANDEKMDIVRGLLQKAIALDENLILAKTLLGTTYAATGDDEKSLEIYNSSLKHAEKLGDKLAMGESLFFIGSFYHNKGKNITQALDYYSRSLTIQEEIGDKNGMRYTLGNLGYYYSQKGDLGTALEYHTRTLEIEEELDDKHGIVYSLSNIGDLYYINGDYGKALYNHVRSLNICDKLDDEYGMYSIGYSNGYMGVVYINKREYVKAIPQLEKAITIVNEMGITHKLLFFTTHLYLSYKNLGKEYDINDIHAFIKDAENIEFDLNYAIYQLLEDTSYLETAYSQVQEKADNLEPDVAAKFLIYPIPKAIVEEWEKVK